MQEPFDILQHVQRVNAPQGMYGRVLERLSEQRRMHLPASRVRLAALALFCLFSAEIYLGIRSVQRRQNSTETLVPLTDNNLYYE